jgi:hypothetical protein
MADLLAHAQSAFETALAQRTVADLVADIRAANGNMDAALHGHGRPAG